MSPKDIYKFFGLHIDFGYSMYFLDYMYIMGALYAFFGLNIYFGAPYT